MRYRAIQEHDRRYPIRLMCRALSVSPAGYYAWRGRPESRRVAANRTLLATIRVIHQESRQTYGSPRIWRALHKQGYQIGEHRVARLMRHDGLRAKTVKKWRATPVKTEVGCPQITDLRCPLFTDEIVRLSCSDCGIGHYLLSGRDGSLPQEPGLLLLT